MTDPVPAPQQGPAGEFRLDVELAHEAVTTLINLKDRLSVLRKDAVEVSRQAAGHPGVVDLISREAFDLLALRADGAVDSLTAALDRGIEHVDRLISQMRTDIDLNERADGTATQSFQT